MKAIIVLSRHSFFIALAAVFALSMSVVPSAVAAEQEVARLDVPPVESEQIDSLWLGILDEEIVLETPSTRTPALHNMSLVVYAGNAFTTKNLDAIDVQHASQGNASEVPCPEGRTGMLGVNLKQPFFQGESSRRVVLTGTYTNSSGQSQNFGQELLNTSTSGGTPKFISDEGIQILAVCSKAS